MSVLSQSLDSARLRLQLNEAWALTDSADYGAALSLYKHLIEETYKAKSWKNHVEALRGLGLNYTRLGKEQKSMEVRKHLVEMSYLHLPVSDENIGISEKELSISYQRLGMYDSAFIHIRKALEHNLKYLGEFNLNTSRTVNSIGFLYSRLESLDSAIKYYQWALDIQTSLDDKDYYMIGISQNNLGASHRKLGHFDLQAKYLKLALESFKRSRGPNHPVLATIYNNLANAYKQIGDSDNQLQFIEKALEIRQKNFEEEHPYIAESYTTLAEFHLLHFGSTEAFFNYARKAQRINQALFPDNHEKIAAGLHLLGKGYEGQEEYQKAYSQYDQSREMYELLFGKQHGLVATELMGMASCLYALGQSIKAKELLDQALEIRLNVYGVKHPFVSLVYKKQAEILLQENQFEAAMNYLQEAISSLSTDFGEKDLLMNPSLENISSKMDLLTLLKLKGNTSLERSTNGDREYWLQVALNVFNVAMDLADEIRFQLISNSAQDQITELAFPAYQGAVESAWQLYSITGKESFQEDIWNYVERSRSFRLRMTRQKEDLEQYNGVPDSLVQREKDLEKEISALQERVTRTDDSLKVNRLSNLIFTKELKYEQLQDQLKIDFPQYYYLLNKLSFAPVSEVQKSLENREAVISYFSDEERIRALVLSKDQFFIKDIALPEGFGKTISNFRTSISNVELLYDHPKKADSLYHSSAYKLFELLLKEILLQLPEVSSLVILPDQVLSTVNFEALLTEETSGNDYSNFPYLLHSYKVSYSHSISLQLFSSNNEKSGSNLFGGFAPSYSSEKMQMDSSDSKMFNQLVRSGEWNLPGAIEEVKAIQQILGGEMWLEDEATEQNFVQNANDFEVLHLAMHGLLDDADPLGSELVFSLTEDSVYDGHLSVREIYALDLNSSIVVLSACNSGFGESRVGEGLISLSQAFQYAGSPRTITSLWKVSDETTREIMINMYQSIANGIEYRSALRKGKLSYLESVKDPVFGHPYYWAGFVYIGKAGDKEDNGKGFWMLAGIALAIFLGLFFTKKLKLG